MPQSDERGRPFYVFVVATNRASLESFRRYVITRLDPQPLGEFRASSLPIEFSSEPEYRAPFESARSPWFRYGKMEMTSGPSTTISIVRYWQVSR